LSFTRVPPRNYTIAPDVSTASFSTDGLPRLSGTTAYTATTPPSPGRKASCGLEQSTHGTGSGTLEADFDVIGHQTLEPTSAWLDRAP
jgi:hypothetical protein